MRNFKELIIWQRSMGLAEKVLESSKNYPSENRYDLTSQIIRSAVSIPSNIAEGSSRSSDREFTRFLEFSLGSANELETQLILSKVFDFLEPNQHETLLKDVIDNQKMIATFYRKVR